jgi:hypothetical protein
MRQLIEKFPMQLKSKTSLIGLLFGCCWGGSAAAQELAAVSDLPPSSPTQTAEPGCTAFETSKRPEAQVFRRLQGKKIRNINYLQLNVFDENDPDENNSIYRFLNWLHIKTKPAVVKSQLLFQAGDKINYLAIEETGRILRGRKYLSDAYIVPQQLCGDQVDVLVVTRDAWALEPEVSFSHRSGENQSGIGLYDGNIFGTGNSLSIGYDKNEQRNAVSYDFSNPHFMNKPVAVHLLYEDTSDGRNQEVDISHPFYSLDTPWSGGGKISDLSQIETIRSRGEVVNKFRHRDEEMTVYYGRATDINDKFTQRWLVGYTEEQNSFYPIDETLQPIPELDKASYPWIEYQYVENKFGSYINLNQIRRPEDVATGEKFILRLGMAGTNFGNPDDVLRYMALYDRFFDLGEKHIMEFEAELDGRQHLGISGLDPNLFSSSLSYHYLQNEKNRWYARAEFSIGENLPQYDELTVGGITGLRGYPIDFARGEKRYVLTLERRYFSDVHLFNLLRVGGVVFFDMGKAWGLPNESYAPLLSDVGFGLRFSSTKVRIGNVIHVDIAMPLAERSGIDKYQFIVGAEQKF